jgi:hypothetical protein
VTEPTVDNLFARAWDLLAKNPIIIVPGIIIGILAGIVNAFAVGLFGLVLSAAVILAVGVFANLLNTSYTVGMAGAAWERGTATFADGSAAWNKDAGRLLAALFLIALIGIVLAVITFGLGWMVFLFFAIYAIPAVVLSGLGAVEALKQSFTIATKRFVPTLVIVAAIFVLSLIAAIIGGALHFIPFLGPIISAVIVQTVIAYTTLVIAGEYLATRNAPEIVAAS